jgi:hypothetical protein
MPTPQYTKGAQLIPLSFAHPSFKGLNTEMGGGILPQEWATKLENVAFDENSRPAARKGWKTVTTTPGSGIIKRLFEYYTADGTSEMIASTDANIYDGLTGTATAIEGTLTITDGNIKFVNFNDKVIAFGIGTGGLPAVRTTGNFANITVNSQSPGATNPDGTIGTSAFGRLWLADPDGKTLRYSALLDETRWATADGGGLIDFSKVWPSGQDSIVAVEEFGGDLIVFGSNNTVVLTDGAGASLGIDPDSLYVSDTIPGMGAVSQFAICRAAGDLWVLTPFGVVGLQRELVQKSTPFNNISANVQSGITGATDAMGNNDDITLAYNPHDSMVLAIFPDVDSAYCFDTRAHMDDGTYRASTWNLPLQTASYSRGNENFYGSLYSTVGEMMNYTGFNDDGVDYYFDYESGWLDLGQEMNLYLKFVKRMTSFTFVTANVQVNHKVMYDFSNKQYVLAKAAEGSAVSEYNAYGAVVAGSTLAEYNAFGSPGSGSTVVEYGGGISLRTLDAPLGGGGQYIKIGLRLNTEAGSFVLQQINLYAKVGRLAT